MAASDAAGLLRVKPRPGADEVDSRVLGGMGGVDGFARQPPGGTVPDGSVLADTHLSDLASPDAEAQGQPAGEQQLGAQCEGERRGKIGGDRLELVAHGRVRSPGQVESLPGADEDIEEDAVRGLAVGEAA